MLPAQFAILVVEDDPHARELIRGLLEDAGYTVHAVADAAAALARLEAGGIDLLLVDLVLPGSDGFELCRRARARERGVYLPILVVTGLTGEAERHAGFAAGADDFVTKPFEVADLLDRVRVWARTRQRLMAAHARLAAERARMEETNRVLAQATQAKSEFLAAISHELRTPLNAILGFAELLLDDASSTLSAAQRQRFLRNIDQSGRHLLNVVNDLLDLSKIEAGHMELSLETFEVAVSLRTVAAAIQPLAEKKGLTLLTQAATEVSTLYADEGRFKQVLYNLLSNAVKFTPAGGRVETTAGVTDGVVAVTVADTGPGIRAEDQERIFEAFQQVGSAAARRQEGTGLGLALARRLVELQGGRIWVESTPGAGSRFHFTVPLTPGARAGGDRPVVVAAEAGARLLLVVDAAAQAGERLRALLEPNGYTVLHAEDGSAGVALAVAYCPDAVLIGWRLPGLGGAEVVKRLRATPATRTIPIIVLADEALAAAERALLADHGVAVLPEDGLDRERLLAALARPDPPSGDAAHQ